MHFLVCLLLELGLLWGMIWFQVVESALVFKKSSIENKQTNMQAQSVNSHEKLAFGFNNSPHWGLKKNIIPSTAPSRVTARISRTNKITYGNRAKKYAALPDDRTPRTITRKIITQAANKHSAKSQFGHPIPSVMSSYWRITVFLQRYFCFFRSFHCAGIIKLTQNKTPNLIGHFPRLHRFHRQPS